MNAAFCEPAAYCCGEEFSGTAHTPVAKKAYKSAFQLYSARNFPPFEAVLDGLAAIGYDAVEAFAPNFEDPVRFRRQLDAAGLTCMGFHLPYRGLIEAPERYIDIAHTIGERPLLIPPNLQQEDRPSTPDGWRRIGDTLAVAVDKVAAAGLQVAWHNHEYEFRRMPNGQRPIDLMFEAAGDGLGMEIDFAWVLRGWADPLSELERFAPRILSIQLKDTAPPGTSLEGGWTVPGEGMLDWDALWPRFAHCPAEYLVVEHDLPRDWEDTALRAHHFFRQRVSA